MRFIIGYAGIQSDAYDYIYGLRKSLTGGNTEFEGVSLGPSGSPLQTRHARVLSERFKEHALSDRSGPVSTQAFAVVYVRADQESSDEFEAAFFPATLVFPVEWSASGSTPDERRQSYKELFRLLLEATIRARAVLLALHKELVERANRTPLLLPLRNFRSKRLRGWMKELQATLSEQASFVEAAAIVSSAVRALEVEHPPKKVDDPKRKRPCFLDDHEVEFHAPGKALHGLPHVAGDHPTSCILGGLRRLGAPYHAAFHYDCIKGQRGNLRGAFFSCHEQHASPLEGDPHLNIAPNDFVRA